MAQARAERPTYSFNKGLNSDASPLTFPADFSLDESNFELMADGTRRRRRGLAQEGTAIDEFEGINEVTETPTLVMVSDTAVATGTIMYSLDGATWQYASNSPTSTIDGIAYSPELRRWVLVGSTSTIHYSDSINGPWIANARPYAGVTFQDVAWSPTLGMFVAVGSQEIIEYSYDGVNWSSAMATAPNLEYTTVYWDERTAAFYAGASNGTYSIVRSTDGITWSYVTIGPVTTQGIAQISGSPTELVAASNEDTEGTWYSTDGLTWTRSTQNPTSSGGSGTTTLAYGNGIWLSANGGAAYIFSSTNGGITFNEIAHNAVRFSFIMFDPVTELFYIGGDGASANDGFQVSSSPDGVTWTRIATPANANSEDWAAGIATSEVTVTLSDAAPAAKTFKWSSVAGVSSLNFVVWQIGTTLYFADDTETPADNLRDFTFDLSTLATDAGFDGSEQVDLAHGRGHLIVVGATLDPCYIVYDPDTDTITSNIIEIMERDYRGVVDGIADTDTTTVLSDEYLYNLLNSGWKYPDITTFETAQGNYPAKNMIYYLGYRRAAVPGYAETDGTKEFSSDKLIAELFQDSPAPKGHFIVNPFDRSITITTEAGSTPAYVTAWDPADANALNLPANGQITPALTLVTVTLDQDHSFTVGSTFVPYTYASAKYGSQTGDGSRNWGIGQWGWSYGPTAGSFNYTVEAVPSANQISFYVAIYDDSAHWDHDYAAYYPGVFIYVGATVTITDSDPTDQRPSATAFFAGRAWYSGVATPELSSAIFFSQILESDAQYGKCYQVADPTSENISDLVATDGGVLRIPEMGRVFKMLPLSSSLLVYASNGIWQVGPGGNGYFTADSYSVRKISDSGAVNASSIVMADQTPIYWSQSGIYGIVQDENSGFLTAQPITLEKIETLYSNIRETDKANAVGAYDFKNRRCIWIYTQNGLYTEALLFDIKFQAFTTWTFAHTESSILSVFSTRDTTEEGPASIRFVAINADDEIVIASLSNDDDYTDLDGDEASAYMLVGYDTAQSPSRRKYAPIVTFFMKRTETGYTDLGSGDLVPVNPSSLTMQARWDWTDNTVSGKWGTAQQVYRKPRWFTPEVTDGGEGPDTYSEDGYPIVVSRNKVRGRGRCFHMMLTAGAGRDAHILGWTTNYTVLTDT